jgi:hypothetical protein
MMNEKNDFCRITDKTHKPSKEEMLRFIGEKAKKT